MALKSMTISVYSVNLEWTFSKYDRQEGKQTIPGNSITPFGNKNYLDDR